MLRLSSNLRRSRTPSKLRRLKALWLKCKMHKLEALQSLKPMSFTCRQREQYQISNSLLSTKRRKSNNSLIYSSISHQNTQWKTFHTFLWSYQSKWNTYAILPQRSEWRAALALRRVTTTSSDSIIPSLIQTISTQEKNHWRLFSMTECFQVLTSWLKV